ncbi:MAG: hypothetical protein H6728_02480 [Myxococcales bacterium]|nr:hypothetical protein [Myxococcales bacterium]MCB9641921.1 hypothetical protein [Myxococcales bacterium]
MHSPSSELFQVLSVEEFLSLSARFNYLLAAKEPSIEALVTRIGARRRLEGSMEALGSGVSFLLRSYRNRLRRLGPLAVLHPLRAAHLLILASETPTVLDTLTAFLHDYYEDIFTPDLDSEQRQELEWRYEMLQEQLSEEDRWFLDERIKWLTRRPEEQYHEYLGRLLMQARHTPELIWVKLADRLDNTYDMRVVDEGNDEYFRLIFDVLFLRKADRRHFPTSPPPSPGGMDEAHRLYQMFKNAIFLTLVRNYALDSETQTARRLFDALAAASIQESGRILNQILNYQLVDPEKQRLLLLDAMEYCHQGGVNRITSAQRGHKLDGLFKDRFDHPDRKTREAILRSMQDDKELMVEAALAFLTIFESFLNSSNYHVSGIKASGIDIEDTMV